MTAHAEGTVADHWAQLVTVALLGTDRRDPPQPPTGPLADLDADARPPTPAARLLQQVSACAAVRRAGLVAGEPLDRLLPPPTDPRAVTPAVASTTWRLVVRDWPVLEDEWVLAVIGRGLRLAPELVVPLLARHRRDAGRHARVRLAAGPVADWLIGWEPWLAVATRQPPSEGSVTDLAHLAISPELAAVLGGPAAAVIAVVAGGIEAGSLGSAHRAVLVNLVARVEHSTLPPLATALERVDPNRPTIGLAVALADLARLRYRMLSELVAP